MMCEVRIVSERCALIDSCAMRGGEGECSQLKRTTRHNVLSSASLLGTL